MHGQDHDRAEQDEQRVGGSLEILHLGAPLAKKHESVRECKKRAARSLPLATMT
jgi:hypothetical protein